MEYRIEHDTMGEVKVPADALYAAQTARAVENFPISGTTLERAHIAALAQIKKAAALANAKLGVIDDNIAAAISNAADEVISGKHDKEFPVDIFQTGSGTSSNMNMNEVLASLASTILGSKVHPNDHVNASQSSNDVFPTSVHLAVGQEFGGYAAQIRYAAERVQASLVRVAEVPLGGTAVGTGINTPKGFPQEVIKLLAKETQLPITEARNHFEAQGARDALVEASGALKVLSVSLTKICNDLRWMGSGPNAGLGEIAIPDLQPGSSIMPGKVNPVIPEAVMMVVARVIGNDAAVTWAGASGNFELNVAIPVMGNSLLESIRLLSNSLRLLADKTVSGLEANVERARALAESSPSIVTPLNKYIGYEAAAKIAKHAVNKGLTIREATIELGYVDGEKLTLEQLDKALDVLSMTKPN